MPLNSLHSPFSITTHSHPHRAPHFLPTAPRDLVTIGNRPDSSPSLLPEGTVPPPQALLALGPQDNLLQLPRLPSPLQCTLVSSSPSWLLQYSRRQALSPTWVRGYPPLLWAPFPEICPGLKVTGPCTPVPVACFAAPGWDQVAASVSVRSAQLCLPPAPHLTPEAGRGRGPGGSGEGEKEKQQGEGDPVACLLLLSTFR